MRWDAIDVRAGGFPRIASAAPVGAGGMVAVGTAAAGSAAKAAAASAAPAQRTLCPQLVIPLCVFGRGDVSFPPLDGGRQASDTRTALNVFLSRRQIESTRAVRAVDRENPTKEDR